MEIYNCSNIRVISKDRQFFTKNYDDSYIKGTYEIHSNDGFIVSFEYEIHNSTITPKSVERVWSIYSSIDRQSLLSFLANIDEPIVKGFHRHLQYGKNTIIYYIA